MASKMITAEKQMPKKMSAKQDDKLDRKKGIVENSKADIALDKKRGVPPEFLPKPKKK